MMATLAPVDRRRGEKDATIESETEVRFSSPTESRRAALLPGSIHGTYPDEDVRLAVSRAVAVENPRGWRIAKTKASHKIDVVVALAMACLACVKGTPWAAVDDFEEVFDHGLYGGFVL